MKAIAEILTVLALAASLSIVMGVMGAELEKITIPRELYESCLSKKDIAARIFRERDAGVPEEAHIKWIREEYDDLPHFAIVNLIRMARDIHRTDRTGEFIRNTDTEKNQFLNREVLDCVKFKF